MADDEHLKIIKQGVAAWNSWRQDRPTIRPDLRMANLDGANLKGALLTRVDLRRADLSGTNLERARFVEARLGRTDLKRANLIESNLRKAHLVEADLAWADLSGVVLKSASLDRANLNDARLIRADLDGASLSSAHLTRTNLSGASLQDTSFDSSIFSETIFSDVDLSTTRGLQNCAHRGANTVDYRTLHRSRNVPLAFWQGCGLSDWQIEAAKLSQPGLTQDDIISITYEIARIRGEQPIQLFSPFISYSSKDAAFARCLYASLQANGVRCWFAPEDMKIGDRIRQRVDEMIHLHDKLLIVLSEHSLASQWVEQEIETALTKERETGETVLFPIKVDNAVDSMRTGWPALVRNTRHIGDFTNWEDEDVFLSTFKRVLRDLRAEG